MGEEKKDGQQGFTVSDRRKRYEEPEQPPKATGDAGGSPVQAAGGPRPVAEGPGAPHGDAEPAGDGGAAIGPADFPQLVMKIAEEAVVFMGYHDEPKSGHPMANLPVASWHIDLLEVLRAKTKGNLAADEAKLLEEAVANLKLLFVRASGLIKH